MLNWKYENEGMKLNEGISIVCPWTWKSWMLN